MKWTEAMRTGVPHLDEQHKMLFRMSEDFQAGLDDGRGEDSYAEFLRSLELYVRAHFGAEERCMWRHRCPAYAVNSRAHQAFSASLAELVEGYRRDGYSAAAARSAMEMVDQWLVGHIGRIDVQLRAVLPAD